MLLLGKRIKELRTKHSMTQQQLGNAINVTKVSICCYENGTRTPTLDTLIDLANVFRVDLSYLLGSDVYVVADQDNEYGMSMAKEEIDLIKELKNHPDLYQQLINDPKRTLDLIEKKLRIARLSFFILAGAL